VEQQFTHLGCLGVKWSQVQSCQWTIERPHTARSAWRFWACITHGRPCSAWPTYGRSRSRDHVPGSLQPRCRSDETDCGPRKVAGRSVDDPKEPLPTLRPGHFTRQRKLGL